jgi:hypothetical protein
MNKIVKVEIPVDIEAAEALRSPERVEAVGRYVSWLLKSDRSRELLAEAIAEAKKEVHAAGLTDEEIDAELEAYNSERRS